MNGRDQGCELIVGTAKGPRYDHRRQHRRRWILGNQGRLRDFASSISGLQCFLSCCRACARARQLPYEYNYRMNEVRYGDALARPRRALWNFRTGDLKVRQMLSRSNNLSHLIQCSCAFYLLSNFIN
jgi:hypothetical protein